MLLSAHHFRFVYVPAPKTEDRNVDVTSNIGVERRPLTPSRREAVSTQISRIILL